MNAKVFGKKAIGAISSIINLIVLTSVVSLIAIAGYALWDSSQLYEAADKSHYEIYRPTAESENRSFKELQALNEDVFGWLTVYGTNIDYPLVQGEDNMTYVNTSAEGKYSLSGAIFLDSANSLDFSDFNHIIYGHHMAKKTMFGEIGDFADKEKFDTHKYGYLFFGEKDHGLEFFAFVHADAYDFTIFNANVDDEFRGEYLENLLSKAIHTRDIGISTSDRIVLLSTCSSDSTNGRDILVARLTDTAFDEPTAPSLPEYHNIDGYVKAFPLLLIAVIILTTLLIIRTLKFLYSSVKSVKNRHINKADKRQ